MKKSIKKKGKKGFTLVELLAVIVILAIVVGISIPTILGVINGTKKKALQTAADAAARWFDKQYELYKYGDDLVGDTTISDEFVTECFGKYLCDGKKRILFTSDLAKEAGLNIDNFVFRKTNFYSSYYIKESNIESGNAYARIHIDSTNGKSCISLATKASAPDYPGGVVVCGGTCQNTDTSKLTYCKPINFD